MFRITPNSVHIKSWRPVPRAVARAALSRIATATRRPPIHARADPTHALERPLRANEEPSESRFDLGAGQRGNDGETQPVRCDVRCRLARLTARLIDV